MPPNAPAEPPKAVATAGGEPALEAYARLHTACCLTARVNRRGKSVCIDEHIQ